MHIISSFEHSDYLELAIQHLRQKGVNQSRIAAVPLKQLRKQKVFIDSIHRSDGVSLIDLAAVLGTVFSVIGASVGFELRWGPIYWGLIGLAFGALLGFAVDYVFSKRKGKGNQAVPFNTEVVLIVQCDSSESSALQEVLKQFGALGIGLLGDPLAN